ncbi:MAG: DUF4031 domain-containing protein [Fimbriimonas sp.]
MAVYVDLCLWPAHGRLWCHLMSDGSQEELLAFARQIGVEEGRLQRAGSAREHFDLPDDLREIAILAGAVAVSPQEIVRRCVWPKLPSYAGRFVSRSTTEQE